MLDSLVRVSRRGKENHFASISPTQHSKRLYRVEPIMASLNSQRPCCKQQEKNEQKQHWFPSLPFQQFQVLFNSIFKVLFIFPSRYLFAIGLPPIFSFRWNLPPTLSCNPKQLDSLKICVIDDNLRQERESHPLCCLFPKDLARNS